jgi:aminopeptidase
METTTTTFDVLLQRYVTLIAEQGINVQPGQFVQISTEIYHRRLIQLLVQELYARGAKFVHVDYTDPLCLRARMQRSQADFLDDLPDFYTARFNYLVDCEGAALRIVGPEFPDSLSDIDPLRMNSVRKAAYTAAKRYYTDGLTQGLVHWCVAAAATPQWGKRVFPHLSEVEAESALWDQIFKICRVSSPDFLELWRAHNASLIGRAEQLTSMQIRSLRFVGPGTDLVVGLSPRAIFKGGADISHRSHAFQPNIPTEECFTTPDWRQTNGVVRATRPFLVHGVLIKDLTMVFKEGEIESFSCSQGAGTFEAYIRTDEGARRLGEVALVGIDSPIFQSGLVFEEILFDENAACHIALGSAYKSCLCDGSHLSDMECQALGCNTSMVHTDIMISSEHVDVYATLANGETHLLLEKGRWIGAFSVDGDV